MGNTAASIAAAPRRHLWLGGWGVPPEAVRERLLRAYPGDAVGVLPPCAASVVAALQAPAGVSLGGWSLGAHLLWRAMPEGSPAAGRKVTLVCPFAAFPAEAGQGGRVAATRVRFLRRWLRSDPTAALADFYQRAGLALPAPVGLPYAPAELAEGLDYLESVVPLTGATARFASPSLRLFAGACDPLLDSRRLREVLPGLTMVPGAGHDLADFVREIASAP